MKDRVLRDFASEDIHNIADTFHNWRKGEGYENITAFCKSAKLDEIRKYDYVLTPGRYVGAVDEEGDGEPFAEKISRLAAQLSVQFAEGDRFEAEIKKNLAGLGYGTE
jgi:type I restriction enzyme M protein